MNEQPGVTAPRADVIDESSSRELRGWGLAAALLAAALAMLLAPGPWPTDPVALEVDYLGTRVASANVKLDTDTPVTIEGRSGADTLTLSFPGGIPTGEAIRGTLTVERNGDRVRPALDAATITLAFPDGTREPIPLLAWDDDQQALVATRHPPVQAATALGLLAAAVVLWVTAAIPLFATAIAIPVVLAVSGIAGPVEALAPFFHPIIALFFAGFLLAEAMRRVDLDRWVAATVIRLAGRSPASLFVALMATAAFLSMWMSNTAAVAVLIPIALAVAAPIDHPGFTKVLVLGTAYAATIGGVGSAIGTPANLLAIEFLDTFVVREITFAGWFGYGLPMVAVFLPFLGVYLWWRYGVRVPAETADGLRDAAREHATGEAFGRDRTRVLAVFAAVAATWLLQSWHGIHPGLVALGGVVVLALTRDVREEDLGRINWTALLTFGGGLTLGLALTTTGVADWIASRLGGLGGLPDPVAVAVVATVTLLLTTVASNTASAATLIPLAIPLAGLLGVDVTTLVVVVAIASSIDFALIIGTPPTMLAYSTGLFRPAEILRAGAVLDLLGLALLLTVVTWIWGGLGLV
ncbi:MAG: DASS family sodium-coupled anion symporter [Nitriliruptorales bacterium]|nr:DASS family sodium-coupled anion symporter [Nitriliruptorales bacterium]